MTTTGNGRRYAFESFEFDAATGELCTAGRSIKLRPQLALALELLLSRRPGVVSREELRLALWPDERIVLFEASIAVVIRELRRALRDSSRAPRFIETIPRRGYRFVAPSTELSRDAVPVAGSGEDRMPQRVTGGRVPRLRDGLVLALVMLQLSGSGHVEAGAAAAPEARRPVTVAVLPFEDLTGRREGRALAESLPRELVGRLGPALPDRLRVVDRIGRIDGGDPVFPHQVKERADFLLQGSVRNEHDTLVISARLLSGGDDVYVWGEDYRRDAEDVALAEREVAARIADRVLSSSLKPASEESFPSTANAPAAAAYRRGLEAFSTVTRRGTIEAVAAFEEASAIDPVFAAAHARLGETLIGWPGPAVTMERVERARRAARHAIELDSTNAVAYRVLGEIALYFDRDWPLAGRMLERSVQLAPADASGHKSLAAWLSARGRHEEALQEIALAGALDPASVVISIDAMLIRFHARDFEQAISAAWNLKQLWPGNGISPHYIILSGLAMHDLPAAAAEARSALAGRDRPSGAASAVSAMTDTEALERYWAARLRTLARDVRDHSADPASLALVHVQLGERDRAAHALETALASRHFSYLLPYLGVSPAFDSMCGNPRFELVLRSLRQFALNSEPALPRCASTIAASVEGVGT